jgi:hypothetical protein
VWAEEAEEEAGEEEGGAVAALFEKVENGSFNTGVPPCWRVPVGVACCTPWPGAPGPGGWLWVGKGPSAKPSMQRKGQ